ncbi:transmembrane protein, putative (macronuclear) [Tetrahymena thermophila SB210]|uniref:Transmembrane protein, putative n=1 Tax=Tetrahymena thermophila (strain SB210) TaxID=312017 RepID=I7MEY6_TETTS|nr:transmembrane protein, putative [Tetrahymena thermophila SB210]EAR98141.1 transmembrane protein, putative [Tetrahymena thermophila SB210]|eukprot:XP_001018386.1 transmembrane protein, putative [Tetrahymena thermophila SB210]
MLKRFFKSRNLKVAIIALCVVGTVYYATSSGEPDFPVIDMFQNSISANTTYSDVISSERKMKICGGIFHTDDSKFQHQCQLFWTTQDIVAKKDANDSLTVYIAYKSFEYASQINPKSIHRKKPQILDFKSQDQNLIFRAKVTANGELLKLECPADKIPNDLLVKMTEKLIDQYFPNLNATLYDDEDYDFNLLGASKSKAPKRTERTSLGKVKPKFTFKRNKDGSTELKKSYTHDDIVNKDNVLKKPNLKYHSKFTVKDGKVRQNNEALSFSLNRAQQNMTLASSNGQDNNQELIGSVNVDIESNLTLTNVTKNVTFIRLVDFYEQNIYYRQLNTTIDEPLNIVPQPQKTVLQDGSDLIFQRDYQFFQQSILNNNFYLSASIHTSLRETNINADIFLNNKSLFSIYSQKVEHKFLACDPIQLQQDYSTQEFKIFSYTYPLYGGIVKIPVNISVNLKYGWAFTEQKREDYSDCQLQFKPYVQPNILGTASVNFLNMGEAGIRAHGILVDTVATFEADVNNDLDVQLGVDILIQPYSYDISMYYSVVECPSSSGLVSLVKIIASNVGFQSDCKLDGANQTIIPLKSDKSDNPIQKNIFSTNFNVKQIAQNALNNIGGGGNSDAGSGDSEQVVFYQ